MRKILAWIFFGSLLAVVSVYGLVAYRVCGDSLSWLGTCNAMDRFPSFYAANIRASLFAGFLSLGGFLLSLKAFMVINIKKDVYDSDKYKEIWESQNKLSAGVGGRRYDPLRELSDALFVSILACIVCAILQLSVGLIAHPIPALVCVWSALFAAAMLVLSLVLIKNNLAKWFSHLGD